MRAVCTDVFSFCVRSYQKIYTVQNSEPALQLRELTGNLREFIKPVLSSFIQNVDIRIDVYKRQGRGCDTKIDYVRLT